MANATPVSPVRTDRPELRIDAAAINDVPVELDGTPTTPNKAKFKTTGLPTNAAAHELPLSVEEKQKLADLIKERKTNPAVVVDLPGTPQAEELAISGAVDEAKK